MRIVQVRFKNLNSLVGEWEIDLTHPVYLAEGIFAITGATGAGKSTILDAISLALYGRTPRLNRVSKSSNEIMSRQTGECFAEVTFETQKGRFRCHWSQRRAHRKAKGELQAPKHEIAEVEGGVLAESQCKGTAAQIEWVTGMNFERFTRSMLLAQGDFAAFLQAPANERAPILEQITGTEIYSQISKRVHERQRAEQETLQRLQTEVAGIVVLEAEQEALLQQSLVDKRQEEVVLAQQWAETGRAIVWLQGIAGLTQELHLLQGDAVQLQSELEAFWPRRQQLTQALQAATLDGLYATLTAVRKEWADAQHTLAQKEALWPALQEAATTRQAALLRAEAETIRQKTLLQEALPALQRVRLLDQGLLEQKKGLAALTESCRKDLGQMEASKKSREQAQNTVAQATESLKVWQDYLTAHAQDAWLIGGMAGIEEQVTALQSGQKALQGLEGGQLRCVSAVTQAEQRLAACQRQRAVQQQAMHEAVQRLQQGRAVLQQLLGDRLLREYRSEQEGLLREMAFLARIAELEALRDKLVDGEPCPLCGAQQHPYAEGNIPVPDTLEQRIAALSALIHKADAQEEQLKKLEHGEGMARQRLMELDSQESAAATEKRVAETALQEMRERLQGVRAEVQVRLEVLVAKLQPLGVQEGVVGEVALWLDGLRGRLRRWQEHVKAKTETEAALLGYVSEVKRLEAVLETQGRSLAEKQAQLQTEQTVLAARSAERQALYGDKSPDAEERRLLKQVGEAEMVEKQERLVHQEQQQKLHTLNSEVMAGRGHLQQRTAEKQAKEEAFLLALAGIPFVDEQAFLAVRLRVEQREALALQAKQLDDRQTELKTKQQERATRLAVELAKQVSARPLAELEAQAKVEEAALQQLRDELNAMQYSLEQNRVAQERLQEKRVGLEVQKGLWRRWNNLHALIGSLDGNKYRNFVQGVTFEAMIGYANRQLQKMSDRYVLIRDESQPLELNVVDSYQAGEVRSTKNLSGGESFLVSLALALGLSQMASRNVRVDSLFLDEGFGTLDEEALESALGTLSTLQQDGKLIGIISHISALKERISTQIQVVIQTGGRSLLLGPGCVHHAARG